MQFVGLPHSHPRSRGACCDSASTQGRVTASEAPGARVISRGSVRAPPRICTVTGNDCGLATATAKGKLRESWVLGVTVDQYSHPRYCRAPSGAAQGSPQRPSTQRSVPVHAGMSIQREPSSAQRWGSTPLSAAQRTAEGGHPRHPTPGTQKGRSPAHASVGTRAPFTQV